MFFLFFLLRKKSLNLYIHGILQGRIAQLVELLSYTQVVIGSSPVAPKLAGVVQLVRAPPCHGGSCGFEPRLPRMRLRDTRVTHNVLTYGKRSFRNKGSLFFDAMSE